MVLAEMKLAAQEVGGMMNLVAPPVGKTLELQSECVRGVPRPASAARASGLISMGVPPRAHFPNGIVSSVSFVSTTNTARSLAGFVSLAFALTAWRSPGSSEKLCPAL